MIYSVSLNIFMYILIAHLVYKILVKPSDNLPEEEGYRKFSVFLSIIWPATLAIFVFDSIQGQEEEL